MVNSGVKLFGKNAAHGPRIKKMAVTCRPSGGTLESFGFVRGVPKTATSAAAPTPTTFVARPKITKVARMKTKGTGNPVKKRPSKRFSAILDDDTEEGIDLLDDDDDYEADDAYDTSMIDDSEATL